MQMRNWVRIDVSFSVKVFQLSEEDAKSSIEDMMVGTILDLSGGGLGFSIPKKLKTGDRLSLEFNLPGHGVLRDVRARVVRVVPPKRTGDVLYFHSVNFEEGEDFRPKQEQIIQYVFEQQRYNARMKEKN
jgi:c-di-GMP-binding flagellar brake protein YcgR